MTWCCILLSLLAATPSEFVGPVRRIGWPFSWFLSPVNSFNWSLHPGHVFPPSKCSSGRTPRSMPTGTDAAAPSLVPECIDHTRPSCHTTRIREERSSKRTKSLRHGLQTTTIAIKSIPVVDFLAYVHLSRWGTFHFLCTYILS
jgi:hypothetical protein